MDPEHWLGLGVVAVVAVMAMRRRNPNRQRSSDDNTADTTGTLATDWGGHEGSGHGAHGCDVGDSGDFGCSDGGGDD